MPGPTYCCPGCGDKYYSKPGVWCLECHQKRQNGTLPTAEENQGRSKDKRVN